MIIERTDPPLTGSEQQLLTTFHPTSCASTSTAPPASSPARSNHRD